MSKGLASFGPRSFLICSDRASRVRWPLRREGRVSPRVVSNNYGCKNGFVGHNFLPDQNKLLILSLK